MIERATLFVWALLGHLGALYGRMERFGRWLISENDR